MSLGVIRVPLTLSGKDLKNNSPLKASHMVDATALILEDSQTQAQIIAKMIEAQGWTPLHFDDLRDAIEALRHVSVQAMFLDVFVGMYNSITNIRRFRELAPDTPIIIMTAGSSREAIEETLRAARKTKVDYVLRKPFTETHIKDIFGEAYSDLSQRCRRKHVLIIDDSQTIRSLASTSLKPAGYRISQCASMEEAFENINIAHVDVVLCDIFMPGMGGFKGIRTLKRVWPQVNVIAMSAGIENTVNVEEALSAARKIGADGQVKKPFTSNELLALIDRTLMLETLID
jgi:CheY-like chemotaxis protein